MDSEKYEYRLTYQVYPQLGGIVAEYVVKNGQDEILRLTTAKSMEFYDSLDDTE